MSTALEGRNALITGGHRKLGLAIAQAFVQAGARVLIVGRDAQRIDAAVEELGRANATGLSCDLRDADAAQRVVQAAAAMPGGPRVLVNAAGVFVWRPFLELAADEWQQTLDVQLTVPFRLTQALARWWRDQETASGASVINIGSVHGAVGDANAAAQCAAKAGLVGLTQAAAEALRPLGIRVNAILAGAIAGDSAARRSDELTAAVTQGDLAAMALYLASDAAQGITGAALEAYGSSRPVIGK